MKTVLNLDGVGAVYRRVSDDRQDAQRQRTSTEQFLADHGVTVDSGRVFEDVGWSRHETHRPAFSRLMEKVDAGEVDWILVDRPDRFGTADKWELASYIHRLRRAGCRLVTVDGRELTASEIGPALQTFLDGETSERELREKSVRVLDAMRQRAEAGRFLGGSIPYGLAVACFRLGDSDLVERWRVEMAGGGVRVKVSPDGLRVEYKRGTGFPATEDSEYLQLRPVSDLRQLDWVRRVFTRFATEAVNYSQLAKWLNDSGVRHYYAAKWEFVHVRAMLRNPLYIGQPAWNKTAHGTYTEYVGGGRQPLEVSGKPAFRFHGQADWVKTAQPIFPPIVPLDVWEAVQAKLATAPVVKKAPRSAELWLRNFLVCHQCGKVMRGRLRPTGPQYICSTYHRQHKHGDCPCRANSVAQAVVEEHLTKWLDEAGQDLAGLAGVVTPQPTTEAETAYRTTWERAYTHYCEMCRRIGVEPEEVVVAPGADPNGRVLINPDLVIDEGTVERQYRQEHQREQQRHQHRFEQLDAEHTALTMSLARMPSERSRAKVVARINEIEAEQKELEGLMVNHADEWRATVEEMFTVAARWESARRVFDSEANSRRKAEVLGRVLDRIVLHFRPTGKKKPTSELVAVEFVPVVPNSSPATRRTCSSAPTRTSPTSILQCT